MTISVTIKPRVIWLTDRHRLLLVIFGVLSSIVLTDLWLLYDRCEVVDQMTLIAPEGLSVAGSGGSSVVFQLVGWLFLVSMCHLFPGNGWSAVVLLLVLLAALSPCLYLGILGGYLRCRVCSE